MRVEDGLMVVSVWDMVDKYVVVEPGVIRSRMGRKEEGRWPNR